MEAKKADVMKKLEKIKILPLYAVKNLDDVEQVGKALEKAEIPAVEVVLRTELGYAAIAELSKNEKILVGAGTVRNAVQAKRAIEEGAEFIITPGIIREVIEYCNQAEVLCIPGAVTPSEIEYASSLGLTVLKYFPADVYGGIKGLKALSGPYPDTKFVPTGGINENNFVEYLQLKNVLATGGSFVMPERFTKNQDFEGLTAWMKQMKEKVENCD